MAKHSHAGNELVQEYLSGLIVNLIQMGKVYTGTSLCLQEIMTIE